MPKAVLDTNACQTRSLWVNDCDCKNWSRGGPTQRMVNERNGFLGSRGRRWWGRSKGIEEKMDSRVQILEKNHQPWNGSSSMMWLILCHIFTLLIQRLLWNVGEGDGREALGAGSMWMIPFSWGAKPCLWGDPTIPVTLRLNAIGLPEELVCR